MKTHMLVATCLVLGSSSAAMADSFSVRGSVGGSVGGTVHGTVHTTVQARAAADLRFRDDAVRDHRSPYGDVRVAPAAPIAPVRFTHPIAYPTTYTTYPAYPERPIVALPAVTGATWDCQNWDPSLETSSVCAAFDAGRPAPAFAPAGGEILLGVRDAAIPDHQYITADGQAFRKIVIEGNDCAPAISRVAVKFMDGSVQTVNVDARLREGNGVAINLDGYRRVNQIVMYTPSGATGSYAVLGR